MVFTVFMTSCEQENIVEEDVVEPWKEQSSTNLTLTEIIDINTISDRSHCPAYDNAFEQFNAISDNCDYLPNYCQYLETFWTIDAFTALVDCYPENYCDLCSTLVSISYNMLNSLENIGIHNDYISSILSKIECLEAACSEC